MEQYSIGRVFSRAFEQVKSNFWTLLGFVILSYLLTSTITLMAAIPLLASIGMNASAIAASGGVHDPSAMLALLSAPSFWLSIFFVIVVALLAYSVMYAGAFHCLGASSYGERPSLGSCFGVAFKRALPLFLTLMLAALGIMLGYLLLIVPGIILALMWSVAMPASVLEGLGAIESLGRSRQLTKGSKGMIFLTHLLVFVIVIIVEFIVLGIFRVSTTAMLGAGGQPSPAALGGALVGALIMQLVLMIFAIFVMLMMLSLQVSIYRETLLVTEGRDSGIADVFR